MPLSASSLLALSFLDRCGSPMPRNTFTPASGPSIRWPMRSRQSYGGHGRRAGTSRVSVKHLCTAAAAIPAHRGRKKSHPRVILRYSCDGVGSQWGSELHYMGGAAKWLSAPHIGQARARNSMLSATRRGRFKDIQTYKRAHGQDIKRKSRLRHPGDKPPPRDDD
jgi:hypothetical protein